MGNKENLKNPYQKLAKIVEALYDDPKKGGEAVAGAAFYIRNFGHFESARVANREQCGKERLLVNYEFEFYTEDCGGGLTIDGEEYPVRQGMVTVAKPGQLVQMRLPYRCYYLNVSTADPEIRDLFDNLPELFSIWNMDEVVDHLQQMMVLEPAHNLTRKLQMQSHACSIIAILSRYRRGQEQSVRNAFAHQQTLLMIDRYMWKHHSEPLTLNELAKMCNLDPTYFHKLYTAAFGKTPAQRLLRYRIKAAKTGLLSSKVSLSDLAERCGFSSQTYFCYKFRQVTGMTPTQYRDKMLSRVKNE